MAFPSTKHQDQHIYECFCIGTVNKLVDEFDEQDNNNTTYAVLFDGKLPVATARLMQSKTDSLSVRSYFKTISGSKNVAVKFFKH